MRPGTLRVGIGGIGGGKTKPANALEVHFGDRLSVIRRDSDSRKKRSLPLQGSGTLSASVRKRMSAQGQARDRRPGRIPERDDIRPDVLSRAGNGTAACGPA